AIARLGQVVAAPASETASTAYARFFLAMAHQRLGHGEEARRWLSEAVRVADQELAAKSPPPWNRRVTLQILRREAEGLIGRSPLPGPPPPNPAGFSRRTGGRGAG